MLSGSMVRDSGAGAILGLAAGDQTSSPAYGYRTQVAVLTAYRLLHEGRVDAEGLRHSWGDATGVAAQRAVVRGEPSWRDDWRQGHSGAQLHLDIASAGVPIGLWRRTEPEGLINDAAAVAEALWAPPAAVVAITALAGAVAGASFGQTGRDLVAGVREIAAEADRMHGRSDPAARSVLTSIDRAAEMIDETLGVIRGGFGDAAAAELGMALAVSARIDARPFDTLAGVIDLGLRSLTAWVATIIGTRIGLVRWPWSIANDTWFAEIGRRLAAGYRMADDLPDPYQVEYRLSHGPPPVRM